MKRHLITELIKWKHNRDRKPLILKGARQVGKTYLLEAFGNECFPDYHILNFEKDEQISRIFEDDLNPKRIIQELCFKLDKEIIINKDLLIFDEIQNCPKALTSLKYFQEHLGELALCAAGSLLGIQLSESSFPVGKVEFLNLYPMSFEEFLDGIGDKKSINFVRNIKIDDSIPEIVHTHLWNQLKIYFIVGGLPEVVKTYSEQKDNLFNALKQVRKKQDDLITTYHADMAKHSGKQNAMRLERLWRNIPAQLARDQNSSAPKFKFKNIIPGINRFSQLVSVIDWLKAAGLIIQTHITNSGKLPFSAYTKENFFKLYLFDVGILGALSQLPPKSILDYDYGSYKGYFAENFIAQEFMSSGVKEVYSWKERTAEVEFLREVNGDVLPIEVKSGWVTQAKSLKVFSQKYQPPYRTIMSANNLFVDHKNKLHRYPLYFASKFPLISPILREIKH
ncbi:ATPase AAA [Candidatus Magnetomorum sp. HK-1]|nr:ATPase AAA [Candidatus Magnetomorum sp. HK-1]